MALERANFSDLAALRVIAEHGTTSEQLAAFHRLVEGLSRVRRLDVYYQESGCDCCSGEYERIPDTHGTYVEADSISEVIRYGATSPLTEG